MHAPHSLDHLAGGIGTRLGADRNCEARLHNEEVTLGALRLLWYSRGTFLLAAVLAVVLATIFLRFGPRSYSAEAIVRFDVAAAGAANAPRLSLDAAAVIESEARIARSRTVAEQVVSRLHLSDDASFAAPPGLLTQAIRFLNRRPEDTAGQPDAKSRRGAFDLAVERVMRSAAIDHENKSYLINIRFRWSDPQVAARLANALAEEYLRERHEQSLIATRTRLSAELSQIGLRFGDRFPTYVALKAQLDEIERSIDDANRPDTPVRSVALGDFTADIAVPAQASPAQVSPNPKAAYALALVGGFILAAAFLLLRRRYDTRLSNEWAVADRLGVRCLGMMPDGSGWRASARAAQHEAARYIAVASGLDVKEQGCRVLVVTSSLPDEGKTAFTTALAGVLAESGQRVLLIDAIPRAHQHRFGRKADAKPDTKSDVKSEANVPAIADDAKEPFAMVTLCDRRLVLARSGSIAEYLAAARKKYDLVIVKSAPVLMLSDAAHLARNADLLMLIVHWRKTPARVVAEALRRLHEAGTPASGVVLANVRLRRRVDATVHDQSYHLARYGKFYASISS